MPVDGEKCVILGTYKSACCDVELVVASGARFPRCQKHSDQPTEWKLLPELLRKPKKLSKSKK